MKLTHLGLEASHYLNQLVFFQILINLIDKILLLIKGIFEELLNKLVNENKIKQVKPS